MKKKRTLATVDEARRDSKKDRTKDFHCLIISYSNTEFTSLQISATIHRQTTSAHLSRVKKTFEKNNYVRISANTLLTFLALP